MSDCGEDDSIQPKSKDDSIPLKSEDNSIPMKSEHESIPSKPEDKSIPLKPEDPMSRDSNESNEESSTLKRETTRTVRQSHTAVQKGRMQYRKEECSTDTVQNANSTEGGSTDEQLRLAEFSTNEKNAVQNGKRQYRLKGKQYRRVQYRRTVTKRYRLEEGRTD